MKFRLFALALGGAVAMSACGGDVSRPLTAATSDGGAIDLMPDFEISAAAVLDGGGVGASMLPDALQLTADQKAQIESLHDAFKAATLADMETLRAIEAQARAARQAGAPREDVRAILATAAPALDRLHAAFAKLQADILAIYTPAQRAWIAAHMPKICGPGGPPQLTNEQVLAIRVLRQDFVDANKADVALIRVVHRDAEAARAAGKSRSEVQVILVRATDAMARVRSAERQLVSDITNLLTAEQQAKWCVVRPHGPRG
ncbi:MAG: Spy/CpxP family protein refolding chaperone [Gemmatimonadaceae bacterium]